jgi:hypothetical protein
MDQVRLPLVSRERELNLLADALRNRQSRLVTGPAGIGKTRLIDEALALTDTLHIRIPYWPKTLHELLVRMAEHLGCHPPQRGPSKQPTSKELKGAILRQLKDHPRCVILDHVGTAEAPTYRFLQQIYFARSCSLVMAARSRSELGYLRRLLWDPREEIALNPLSRADSHRLFDLCAGQHFDEDALCSLRQRVVGAAQGIPGVIVALCQLARRPEYWNGKRLLFAPLWMDTILAVKR